MKPATFKKVLIFKSILAALLPVAAILWAATLTIPRRDLGGVILFVSCLISMLNLLGDTGKSWFARTKLGNLIVIVGSIVSVWLSVYFYTQIDSLLYERLYANSTLDFIYAALALLLIFFLSYKESGPIIPIITCIFLSYTFLGVYLPGFLFHSGVGGYKGLLQIAVLEGTGVTGMLVEVIVTVVMIFVTFAMIAKHCGILNDIISLTAGAVRKAPNMFLSIPVIASSAFGSFSGSILANIAGTGSFTIPLMKQANVEPKIAAGTEVASSTGGQIMPPVLGIAAFIMCEFLDLPYGRIVEAAVIGAAIFYGILLINTYYYCKSNQIVGNPQKLAELRGEKPTRVLWLGTIPLLLSLVWFLKLTVFDEMDVVPASYQMLIVMIVLVIIQLVLKNAEWSIENLKRIIKKTLTIIWEAFSEAGLSSVSIILMMSLMGIIISVLVRTGLGPKLSIMIVDSAGGNLYILLILAYIACIAFGMAVTTVSAYILVVLLVAPALLEFGIPKLAAHFFVFYAAILSVMTPPAAPGVIVGSGIAKSRFIETTISTIKLAIPLFVLPFAFIIEPELLSLTYKGFLSAIPIFIGLFAISYGSFNRNAPIAARIFMVILGVLIILLLLLKYQLIAYIGCGLTLLIFVFLSIKIHKDEKLTAAENNHPICEPGGQS